ncbi:alpha/beta-hydrolase [Schizophyllum commune Tattone D]|nr:alpha/beta-hydrolase [Schizophyllum commune Loenen D]KAI5836455.1 alpha/beta-hydrolase [Schizophyllum commune Tattone D]
MALPSFLKPMDEKDGYQRVFFKHEEPLEDVYGLWWPADSAQPPEGVLLFVPGNPGVVDFYIQFLAELREKNPRWAVLAHAHIGHSPGFTSPTSTSRSGLSFQIQSATDAVDILKSHFARIVLIGHSAGSYISFQVLKQRPTSVDGIFLLFPALCNIADTPSGRARSWLFKSPFPRIVSSLTHLARWIPTGVLRLIQRGYPPEALAVLQGIMSSPDVVYAMLNMAGEEMKEIRELDVGLLEEHRHRIWMFFAEKDDWVGHNRELIIQSFDPDPGSVRVVHGVHGIPHEFCIHHSSELAATCHDWLAALQERIAQSP